jgi:hypothetical protein
MVDQVITKINLYILLCSVYSRDQIIPFKLFSALRFTFIDMPKATFNVHTQSFCFLLNRQSSLIEANVSLLNSVLSRLCRGSELKDLQWIVFSVSQFILHNKLVKVADF